MIFAGTLVLFGYAYGIDNLGCSADVSSCSIVSIRL